MPKAADPVYEERLRWYDALVATIPAVERKGATMPYTALNGNMFSFLAKDGTLVLRLPEPERGAFLERFATTLSAKYGIVQPEYVDVPDALLKKTKELAKYFRVSFAYASRLKPKPAKATAKGRR